MSSATRDWLDTDFYAVLDVAPDAPAKEITKAYKKLAKRWHPDANAGAKDAEERFKEVSAAYEVVGKAKSRAEYDQLRAAASNSSRGYSRSDFGDYDDYGSYAGDRGFSAFGENLGGFGSLFGRMTGSAPQEQRGADLEMAVHLSFEDAVRGVTQHLQFAADTACDTCDGTGAAPGTSPVTCQTCAGRGQVQHQQNGFAFLDMCPTCSGTGMTIPDPCVTCRGTGVTIADRDIPLVIPAGVESGMRLRLAQSGAAGWRGALPGDLYLAIQVADHPVFSRDGRNLTLRLPVRFDELALGADVKVPTLDKPVTVRIAPHTKNGKTLRVRGAGVAASAGHKAGDLLVTLEVVVPSHLNAAQKAALEAMAAQLHDDPRAALFARPKK